MEKGSWEYPLLVYSSQDLYMEDLQKKLKEQPLHEVDILPNPSPSDIQKKYDALLKKLVERSEKLHQIYMQFII